MSSDWQLVRKIFEDALWCPPEERRDYARRLCGENEEVWVEVSSLLDSHESSGSFLEVPAVVHVIDKTENGENQLAVGQRLLHYEIRDLIGTGGMGEVYLARDTRLGRSVAIKLLRKNLSPHFRTGDRLLREARASALLEHPNICQLYEISEVDGLSFIVMQYLVGTTLDEILSEKGLDGATALNIALQVAEGLAEAHRQGIAHRDIKPANVIVSGKGEVKILDFGLAKFLEAEAGTDAVSRLESTGGVMGTVPYMSPEQLLGNPVDARTDVFSFGSMLFEMLCGVSAFGRKSNEETITAVLKAEPDWQLLPPSLRPVLQRCLAKDPSARFASAQELAKALATARKELPSADRSYFKTTGWQRVDATTEPASVLTEPFTGWQRVGKDRSGSVPQSPRISSHRVGSYVVIVALLSGLFYGGYILFKRYDSSQTGSKVARSDWLIPLRIGDKFGFCDAEKKLVIEAMYDDAQPFSEGLAVVNVGRRGNPGDVDFSIGKTGVIDLTGKEIVPLKYDSIVNYTNSLAIVRIDVVPAVPGSGKYGVIDKSGNEVVPPQYDWIGKFVDGFAQIELDRKLGYIDEKGKISIPIVYDATTESKHVGTFSGGLAAVSKGSREFVSDFHPKIGSEVFQPVKGKYGYIDMAGQEIIPFEFDEAGPFRIEKPGATYLAAVKVGNACGYIDRNGEYMIRPRFGFCGDFSEGLAAVSVNGGLGYIDTNGKIVIPPRNYGAAGEFHEGLAEVVHMVGGSPHIGYIDKTGDEVIQPKYRSFGFSEFSNGQAHVCVVDGEIVIAGSENKIKCGFIDKRGNEVIPLKYELTPPQFYTGFVNNLIRVRLDGKWFFVDRNGVEYYEPGPETTAEARVCMYDPAADFSLTLNPNGPWTFGYTSALGGPFVIYDATKVNEHIYYWYRGDHPNAPLPPEVGYNPSEAFTQPGDASWTANGFHLHPGPDGTFSVARWTAATSGSFNVNAVFSLADNGATSVHLLHNSVQLFSDVLVGRDDSRSYTTVISVIAGDTVDFSVGPSGDYFNDSTALVATISNIPCPTSTPTPTRTQPSQATTRLSDPSPGE